VSQKLSRREFLKCAGIGVGGALLAACQPQIVVRTVEVEKVVTRVVSEEVVVEQTVEIETEVEIVEEVTPSGQLPLLRFAMYNFDAWLSALPKMLNDFEQEVGTAQVELESAPRDQFWPRFESQAAAGIAPDLQIGDPFLVARYADTGLYLNIDSYIERDQVNLDDWFLAATEACRFEKESGRIGVGPMLGMPGTMAGTILYYNRELFDAAGLGYPTEDWDRLDVQAAATALTQDSAGNTASSAGFDPDDVAIFGCSTVDGYGTAVHVWNNGGGLVAEDQSECWVDKPESVEIFQWLADLILVDHCNPDPAWFEGQPDVFLTQRIALKLDGSWNLDHYVENLTFDWDVAPVPLGTAGLDRITYAGTNTLHIFSGTQFPDEAWDLLHYIAGPGGQKHFLATGTPCHIETALSEAYMTGAPDHRQVAIDIGQYGRTYYPHLGNDRWKEIYNQEIQAIYQGAGTAKEVCASICENMAEVLAEL
jgi:multiple sugar transport system substrate-binding protein